MNLKNKLKDHTKVKLMRYLEIEIIKESDYLKNCESKIKSKYFKTQLTRSKKYLSDLYLIHD